MPKNADLVREWRPRTRTHKTAGVSFKDLGLLDGELSSGISFRDFQEQERRAKRAAGLYQKAEKVLSDFLATPGPEIKTKLPYLEKIVEQFIDSIKTGNELLLKSLYQEENVYDLVSHMLNVSILAIKLGIGLKLPEEELLKVGLAAILEDIGMQEVPPHLLYVSRRLSPGEYEEVKKHSLYGYKIIRNWGENFFWLAETILHIHERENGNGYPYGHINGKIHGHAKIIGLVDVYEALTHNRPYRKRLLHFDAIKHIIDAEKSSFPKLILKTLIQQLSTYPVNSYVKLNSGEIAQVLEVNPLSPLCPVIKIIYNSHRGKMNTGKIVNLTKTSLLYIVGSVFKEDLFL
jgi:HD-GYP domain-containing protein (c-di-GMP phosphodiesterase class II)